MSSTSSGSRTASEEPPAVPNVAIPSRQVLNNQELASLIVGFFNEAENPKDDNKKALAGLTTLNKCFFHVTTDLFWKKVPSLSQFLRLLPGFPGDGKVQSERTAKAIQEEPWNRFLLYNRKVVHLELSEDRSIKDEMPNHWFFCLIHLPSAPSVLFPKLMHLHISSLAGLNSVLPFQVSQGLRHVSISDFAPKNKYDGLKKNIMASLMAGFATNAPLMSTLAVYSPLTPAMMASFSQFDSLTDLAVSFTSPTPLDTLACLNGIAGLKRLSLLSRGTSGTATMPLEGQHLNEYHKLQGKTNLEELQVVGDGCFIFWGTAFFASSSLVKYSAKTPQTHLLPLQGVFLAPHTLDVLAKRSPNLKKIALQWEEPKTDVDGELETWEDDPIFSIPDGLFQSFSKLHDLDYIDISNVPFIAQDMALQLVNHITELKKLRCLSLMPRPITRLPHHNIVLPTLENLADISADHPSLLYLKMSMNMATVPAPILGPLPTLPGHPLRKMFLTPMYLAGRMPLSGLVSLANNVDRIFPQLEDMTSIFEEEVKKLTKSSAAVAETLWATGEAVLHESNKLKKAEQTLQMWKDVDTMVKNYQGMRKQFAAQAAAMAAASGSGAKA